MINQLLSRGPLHLHDWYVATGYSRYGKETEVANFIEQVTALQTENRTRDGQQVVSARRKVEEITNLRFKPHMLRLNDPDKSILEVDYDRPVWLVKLKPHSHYRKKARMMFTLSDSARTLHMYNISGHSALKLKDDASRLSISDRCVRLKKVPAYVTVEQLRYHLRDYELHPDPGVAIREAKKHALIHRKENPVFRNYTVEFTSAGEARQFSRDSADLLVDSHEVYVEQYK